MERKTYSIFGRKNSAGEFCSFEFASLFIVIFKDAKKGGKCVNRHSKILFMEW